MRRNGYYSYPLGGGVATVKRTESSAGSFGSSYIIKGVGGSTVSNTVDETMLMRYNSPGSIKAGVMAIRVSGHLVYSCTGTPNITIRVKTGSVTAGDVDQVSEVTFTGENNASSKVTHYSLGGVVDGTNWVPTSSTAINQISAIGGAAFAGNGAITLITEPNMTRVAITIQWSAADPANTITGNGTIIELMYPVNGVAGIIV